MSASDEAPSPSLPLMTDATEVALAWNEPPPTPAHTMLPLGSSLLVRMVSGPRALQSAVASALRVMLSEQDVVIETPPPPPPLNSQAPPSAVL